MSETIEQARAIKARGKVLVSASAGAGKTTVMIKRLAEIIENGAELDDILAVTFTKKAAAQMKEKLRKELISRLNGNDEKRREHVRAQLNKIATADVSTIHSFCARLIRTYFYALKVDSSFEVLTEGAECNALRERAMDEVFDGLYADKDADFYLLLGKLRKKRSDKSIREMILSAYDEVRIHPNYIGLLKSAAEKTFTEEGFEGACAALGYAIKEKCAALAEAVEKFALNFTAAVNASGYLEVLAETAGTLRLFAEDGDIFAPPQRLATSVKPRVRPENATADEEYCAFIDGVKKRYKALFKDVADRETERAHFLESGKLARAFTSVLLRFDEVYSAVKREEGKLDYGDLEHFALSLLKGENCDADVRDGIRAKYKYVFVDEYQDVNPIQDEIISAVAGGDLFCVGDLKQAIYGFRGSSSRFFADKCGDSGGEYIILPDNFRSGGKVIEFVNSLFSTVMKPPVCEFDYSDGHAMRGGARYEEGYGGRAEICLFDAKAEEKSEVTDVYSVTAAKKNAAGFSAEGLAVLRLVEEALKSEYYDPDEGCLKRVQAGDICVLTRKRANASAKGIVRALTCKYPVSGVAETNICDRPEIIRILDILSYLENGEQDIPLVSALLSPLGNLTEGELAQIRIFGGVGREAPPFRECVRKYAAENSDDISKKLSAFFTVTDRLRTLAGNLGAARLIDEIVATGTYAATFDSEIKLSALRRLQKEAYFAGGELYLTPFLTKVKAGGYRILAPAALASDCVKVMTMHASKGLEFPVVIVADVSVGFAGDERNEMPFDPAYGFAPKFYDESDRSSRTTVLRRLFGMRKDREELSNEINLFYVACTRAKYALYVLCSEGKKYDPSRAAFASNYADLFDVNAFAPHILPVEPISAPKAGVVRVLDTSRADGGTYAALKEAGEYKYGYELGVELPVKSSASQLMTIKGGDAESEILFDEEYDTSAGTGVDAGIAYHRFLELCDFGRRGRADVESQLNDMLVRGLITKEQRDLLKLDELTAILAMPAFDGLKGSKLYREREFVCRLPSADYLSLKRGGKGFAVGEDDGNGVIVQGAIDLLAVNTVGGTVRSARIIDYKYTGHSDDFVKQKYAPQLALYKNVVCKIYGLDESAVSTTIINIRACRQIELN